MVGHLRLRLPGDPRATCPPTQVTVVVIVLADQLEGVAPAGKDAQGCVVAAGRAAGVGVHPVARADERVPGARGIGKEALLIGGRGRGRSLGHGAICRVKLDGILAKVIFRLRVETAARQHKQGEQEDSRHFHFSGNNLS